MIETCRCAALQDQALPMGGAEFNPVGKGWLIAAFLCIACTLTGSCAFWSACFCCHAAFDGDVVLSAVWDLMMCSTCKAADKAPLTGHVQDIFAA